MPKKYEYQYDIMKITENTKSYVLKKRSKDGWKLVTVVKEEIFSVAYWEREIITKK